MKNILKYTATALLAASMFTACTGAFDDLNTNPKGVSDEELKHKKLSDLNRITHKHIIDEINDWLGRRVESGDTVAVVDAPQLFESGFDKHCDYIVGVIADKNVRIRRIMARDGITKEAAEARIASQKSDEFFVDNCDFIVYNNGGVDALEEQVANILGKIGKRA